MATESADKKMFLEAVQDKSNVKGFTHDFYNYPARFSPIFVREAIKTFSQPGDLIVDPFVGGGTTLVEAKLLGRHSIGFDISSLATFIATTKTTPLTLAEINEIKKWITNNVNSLDSRFSPDTSSFWEEEGYHKNVSGKNTWPIKNTLAHFIFLLQRSRLTDKQRNFLRCSALKTGQWALDNKKHIPTVSSFRKKLIENVELMCSGALEFSENLVTQNPISICINKPSSDINTVGIFQNLNPPSLILTSPPYPGVHVVYHRWQVQGRKETPAPFWIANSLDGHGLSHYAMGGRHEKGLETYYSNILKSFSAIKEVCSEDTLVVQMLAFSNIEWQLPKYLDVMNLAGFEEVNFADNRIWRQVPNRKWYNEIKKPGESSKEVVLFHRLIR